MDKILDIFERLLYKNIRVKNATSFLCGLLAVAFFYFTSRKEEWFLEIQRFGVPGLIVAFCIVFFIAFLSIWLIGSCAVWLYKESESRQIARKQAQRDKEIIRETLESLTEWQYDFLLRFVRERQHQIRSYEIGGYKAVWGPEMQVLISRDIVKQYPGIYEINSRYYSYIEQDAFGKMDV